MDSRRSEFLGIPRQLQLVQYIAAAAAAAIIPRQVGGAATASSTGNEDHTTTVYVLLVALVPFSPVAALYAAVFTSLPEEQVGANKRRQLGLQMVSILWDAQSQADPPKYVLWSVRQI